MVDTSSSKYATYVDSTRSYVVPNSSSWPYSVSPSSGIIQPIQVMSTQLDINHKECGRISTKHSSMDGSGIPANHASPPVNAGLITPKMEDIKTDSTIVHNSESPIMHPNSVTPQHFSPVSTSVSEIPRQTVLMWGSNHIHASPNSTNKSPQENTTEYSMSSVQQPEECLTDISNPTEMCKWAGSEENKSESVVQVQTSDQDSPHHNHSNHHNHHNSRVVMVL